MNDSSVLNPQFIADVKNEVIRLIDLLGIISFAISGVFAAMQRKLDIFGILVMAFVTALGGGTVRDILIGDFPVQWMLNLGYPLIITLSALAAIVFYKFLRNLQKPLLVFDALGLGFFTVLGLEKGLAHGLHPGVCMMLGTITACFGGVIRDVALNKIPLVFQREIYATACIAGSGLYFLLLQTDMNRSWLDLICITFISAIRIVSLIYKLELPGFYKSKKE
ncbi:trimeric intracellular cation channel family protein [Flavisolibacter sp. BT320]|nr:trimeric intracellular cation channel family protein [Flavisolibacter longurius]